MSLMILLPALLGCNVSLCLISEPLNLKYINSYFCLVVKKQKDKLQYETCRMNICRLS